MPTPGLEDGGPGGGNGSLAKSGYGLKFDKGGKIAIWRRKGVRSQFGEGVRWHRTACSRSPFENISNPVISFIRDVVN